MAEAPKPEQGGEVVHLAGLAGLDDEAAARAQALADEVVVHGRDGQQRGDGGVVRVDRAVGEDDDLVAVEDVLLGLAAEPLQGALHAARLGREADGDGLGLEVLAVHPAQALEVLVGEHRMGQLDDARVLRPGGQHVALAAHEGDEAHDHLLADGVDGRVGDLREELVEVVEEVARLRRQHGQRRVVAHRADGLLAIPDHGRHEDAQVLQRVAEGLLACQHAARGRLQDLARWLQLGRGDLALVEPRPGRARAEQMRALISSSGMMRPSSSEATNILPGCRRPLCTIFSGGTGRTPASEAMMSRLSSVRQ